MSPTLTRIETAPDLSGPIFMDAMLRPNRSLTPGALAVLLTLTAGGIGISMAIFLALGAWPVVGFLGLDAGLIWLAFHLHNRAAKEEWEQVRVTSQAVHVAARSRRRGEEHWVVSPVFARVDVHDPSAHTTRVELAAGRIRLLLGEFLSPPEREAFGAALRTAMAQARKARPEEI